MFHNCVQRNHLRIWILAVDSRAIYGPASSFADEYAKLIASLVNHWNSFAVEPGRNIMRPRCLAGASALCEANERKDLCGDAAMND